MGIPNARFKVRVNSALVTITLKDGESLTHHRSSPTDEGWSGASTSWLYYEGLLHMTWVTEGVDCDGYQSAEGECEAALALYPDWNEVTSSQYDARAEAAGY